MPCSTTQIRFADGKKNGLEKSAHFIQRQRSRDSTLQDLYRQGLGGVGPLVDARMAALAKPPAAAATMGFLSGKRLLITGVLNNRSIAYGIARACHREGAELAFSYQGERFKERIAEYAAEFGSKLDLRMRRGRRCADRPAVRPARRSLGWLRRLRARHRVRAARGDCRRLSRRLHPRELSRRARNLGLQLSGHGQGRAAAPAQRSGAC